MNQRSVTETLFALQLDLSIIKHDYILEFFLTFYCQTIIETESNDFSFNKSKTVLDLFKLFWTDKKFQDMAQKVVKCWFSVQSKTFWFTPKIFWQNQNQNIFGHIERQCISFKPAMSANLAQILPENTGRPIHSVTVL